MTILNKYGSRKAKECTEKGKKMFFSSVLVFNELNCQEMYAVMY